MDYSRISKSLQPTTIKKPPKNVAADTIIHYGSNDTTPAVNYDEVYVNEEQIEQTVKMFNKHSTIYEYVNYVYDYLLNISNESILPLFDNLKLKDLYQILNDTNTDSQDDSEEQTNIFVESIQDP